MCDKLHKLDVSAFIFLSIFIRPPVGNFLSVGLTVDLLVFVSVQVVSISQYWETDG